MTALASASGLSIARPESLAAAWAEVSNVGWENQPEAFRTLYPMPGDQDFDDDETFLNLPIFLTPEGIVVCVKDKHWEFPRPWRRQLETRVPSSLRLNFDVQFNGKRLHYAPAGKALDIALRRAVYLCIFRSRRPLSIRTYRLRLEILAAFIRHAIASEKRLADLDFPDLAEVVNGLKGKCAGSVRLVYDELRWWQEQPGKSYGFFTPPPSVESIRAPGARGTGFDPNRIRDDDESPASTSRPKPLPDRFIGALGELAVCLIDEVRPVINAASADLVSASDTLSPASFSKVSVEIIRSFRWPKAFAVTSVRGFRALCNDCQTATQALVSLLLGPRAEELLSLPGSCVRLDGPDDTGGILVGHTYKLTPLFPGGDRDWPLHTLLGRAIASQREYVEIIEGLEFPYLWRSHRTLLRAGMPARGIWNQLNNLVNRRGLKALLDAPTIHHHRFRKSTVRLVVLALNGGPMVVRRLLGHRDLAMTLIYILSDPTIIQELRELSDEDRRRRAAEFIERSSEVMGKGGETLRKAVAAAKENLSLFVPEGRRSQAEVTTAKVIDYLADRPDGLVVQQLVPGLVSCFRPLGEPGACCSAAGLPNVANCDADCIWHAMLGTFRQQAVENVENALRHIRRDGRSSLSREHYRSVILGWLEKFPDIVAQFEDDNLFRELIA
ncbi:site-specific integrase [Mesorhizobium sp. M0491]|uniref:site-specific integrase n=1 Tax=Mesorhizobium sp. M0491 TaxID=2956950 RepID=UPI00333C1468